MVYMTNHTPEQSTQFNFISSGGFGAHYFFTKNTALTLEGRIRHLSNAGIKQPNHGINTYLALAGIAYKY
jgi:predicted porin